MNASWSSSRSCARSLAPALVRHRAGECRETLDPWGHSTTGTTSSERRSGSYTSHDVRATSDRVGTPDNLPYTVEPSVSFTAGANWQKAGRDPRRREFRSASTRAAAGPGRGARYPRGKCIQLLALRRRPRQSGLDDDSRCACAKRIDDSRIGHRQRCARMDTAVPAAACNFLLATAAQWVPLQRDWSSPRAFKAPPQTSRSRPATPSTS